MKVIINCETGKIGAIKAVRFLTGWSLGTSKNFVDANCEPPYGNHDIRTPITVKIETNKNWSEIKSYLAEPYRRKEEITITQNETSLTEFNVKINGENAEIIFKSPQTSLTATIHSSRTLSVITFLLEKLTENNT